MCQIHFKSVVLLQQIICPQSLMSFLQHNTRMIRDKKCCCAPTIHWHSLEPIVTNAVLLSTNWKQNYGTNSHIFCVEPESSRNAMLNIANIRCSAADSQFRWPSHFKLCHPPKVKLIEGIDGHWSTCISCQASLMEVVDLTFYPFQEVQHLHVTWVNNTW